MKAPIYVFKTDSDTGIDKVPENKLVMVSSVSTDTVPGTFIAPKKDDLKQAAKDVLADEGNDNPTEDEISAKIASFMIKDLF
jgi:hypothetical protein